MSDEPRGWEELLTEAANRWNNPNEFLHLLLAKLSEGAHVLDIGYGAGRHLVAVTKAGYVVSGFEVAPNGRGYALARLESAGIDLGSIDLQEFDMHTTPWPYDDDAFHGALAINVIHHTSEGGYGNFVQTVDEVARVLAPGGWFLATIASKDNHKYGDGPPVDAYTFRTATGVEAGIPHSFFDKGDLEKIFGGKFNLELTAVSGEIPEADDGLKKEGALDHWLVIAQRKYDTTES